MLQKNVRDFNVTRGNGQSLCTCSICGWRHAVADREDYMRLLEITFITAPLQNQAPTTACLGWRSFLFEYSCNNMYSIAFAFNNMLLVVWRTCRSDWAGNQHSNMPASIFLITLERAIQGEGWRRLSYETALSNNYISKYGARQSREKRWYSVYLITESLLWWLVFLSCFCTFLPSSMNLMGPVLYRGVEEWFPADELASCLFMEGWFELRALSSLTYIKTATRARYVHYYVDHF